MSEIRIEQITEQLAKLSPQQLEKVYEFIANVDNEGDNELSKDSLLPVTVLSETLLSKEWLSREEDEAWAHL